MVVTWNCNRLGQILLVWASGEREKGKQLWDQTERHGEWQPFRNGSPAPRATCWTLKNPSNVELGDVSWFFKIFHMKSCVDKITWYIFICLFKWYDWTAFSICSPVVKGLKMRVASCVSCHFLSIASMNYIQFLYTERPISAEKSTLAFTHYCPLVLGRSRAHRCACKHQSEGKRGQVYPLGYYAWKCSLPAFDISNCPGWRKARWSSAEVPKIWVSWTVAKLSLTFEDACRTVEIDEKREQPTSWAVNLSPNLKVRNIAYAYTCS